MKRPDTRTMVLGHPLATLGVQITCGYGLFACWRAGSGAAIPAVVLVGMMAGAANASTRVAAYRQWKRQWDALAGPTDASSKKRGAGVASFAAGCVLALVAWVLSNADNATQAQVLSLALDAALVAAVLLALLWTARRLRRRHNRRPAEPVSVIARPLLRVPSLPRAYAALPDYCQRILSRPAR